MSNDNYEENLDNFDNSIERDMIVDDLDPKDVPEDSIKSIESYKNLKKLQKKTLGLFILKLLKSKEHYGYEIKEAIKEEFDVSTSQISTYKTLYKLNNEGLVTCRIIEPFGTTRPRKYYYITPTGVKLLQEAQKFLKNFYSILFDSKKDSDDYFD